MDLALVIAIALIAMALLFDYTNGFHDFTTGCGSSGVT